MKLGLKNSLLCLLILLFITSCSIEKRRYTKGYHTEWNNSFAKRKAVKKQNDITTNFSSDIIHEEVSINSDSTKTIDSISFIKKDDIGNNEVYSQLSLNTSQNDVISNSIVLENKSYGKKNSVEIVTKIDGYENTIKEKRLKKQSEYLNGISNLMISLILILCIALIILGILVAAQSSGAFLFFILVFLGLVGLACFFYFVLEWDDVAYVFAIIAMGFLYFFSPFDFN